MGLRTRAVQAGAAALVVAAIGFGARAGTPASAQPALPTFADVTKAAGIQLRPQQRRVRQEVPARDAWARAAPSSTSTTTAGRTSCSSTRRVARPAGEPLGPGALSQQQNGTFTDVTARAGLAVEMYGIGVAAADYDNDGRIDIYVTALGRNRLFRNLGGRQVRGRDRHGGRRRPRLLDERRVVRLRPRRPARSVRRQLRRVVDREGPVLHARRQEEVVLHAGSRTRVRAPTLYRNRGNGTFENVTEQGRASGSVGQGARRRAARLRRRRLARSVRRQRHAAEPLVPQQAATARSPTWPWRRASRSAKRASPAPAWASTPPTTTAPAGQSLVIGNFSNEMMALYTNEGNGPVHRRGARVDDRQDVAAQR